MLLDDSDLDDEHVEHLLNVTFGNTLARKMPDHIEQRLVKEGYLRRVTGGHIYTNDAHRAIMTNDGA